MNTGHCLACGDPLGIESRADRRTCSDLCRKRVSLARRAGRPLGVARRAHGAVFRSAAGHRATSGRRCETWAL
jgi:hypothetical protein